GGFTREETENALIDLNFLGIDNVLLLRGDAIKTETSFVPEKGGHDYAIDLVKQVVSLNKGKYIDDDLIDVQPTDFCIGVAGYPEKHFEAPNMKSDIKFLKQKIDAGANYIVTQMFFDNEKYFEFVNNCLEAGITIPIIPGLKPLTTKKQASILPKTFKIDIPDDLLIEIVKCTTDEAVKQVGIEWCIQQSKSLIKFGAPCLHYYTMGNAAVTKKIAASVF
ncbi:MAG: methylenetetrahydrofolate reductase, partial [Bacteroidota bacterium]